MKRTGGVVPGKGGGLHGFNYTFHNVSIDAQGIWPLTPKIDRAIWHFLKLNIPHRA